MKIVINDNIELSEMSGNIWTGIYIENQGISFPNEDWTDLTSDILQIWKTQIMSMHGEDTIICRFYEGPYWIVITSDKDMNMTINGVTGRGKTEQVDLIIKCSYKELMESLCKAMRVFLKILYDNDLSVGKYAETYNHFVKLIKECKRFIEKMDL